MLDAYFRKHSAAETCGYPHAHTNGYCPLGPKDAKGYPICAGTVPKRYWKERGLGPKEKP